LGELQKEIEARGSLEDDKPKKKDKDDKDEDGMADLKKFFSGKEGFKRSQAFIKFAKLLTEGKDGDKEEPEDKKKI